MENTNKMISLNGTNYQVWKEKMEDLLYIKEYYKPIFQTVKPDENLMMTGKYFTGKHVVLSDNGSMIMC